ncbi:MAG: hypothetical protein P8X68_15775 [Desulfobacterales bacterium]|jgi:hypothetical protein
MDLNKDSLEKLSAVSVAVDQTRCALCHRDLKSFSEQISGEGYVICESCYRGFLYPNRNGCDSDSF